MNNRQYKSISRLIILLKSFQTPLGQLKNGSTINYQKISTFTKNIAFLSSRVTERPIRRPINILHTQNIDCQLKKELKKLPPAPLSKYQKAKNPSYATHEGFFALIWCHLMVFERHQNHWGLCKIQRDTHILKKTLTCLKTGTGFRTLGEAALAQKCNAVEGFAKENENIIESTVAGTVIHDVGIILTSEKVSRTIIVLMDQAAKRAA